MAKGKCNLCQGNEAKRRYVITRFQRHFIIEQCKECGLLFQWPQPEKIDELYNEGYYKGTNEYSYIDEREDKFLRDIETERRIKTLLKFFSKNKKLSILDVGCSFGSSVSKAKEMGLEAKGIDVSNFATHTAFCEGINVEKQDVCQHVTGHYDIITMAETIEHLRDPYKALQNCHRALNQDGILLIQTTNMDSLVRRFEGKNSRYFLPGHLFYFSLKTLTEMLKRNRFKILKVYYGHETGMIPAIIRKSIANMGRYKWPDLVILFVTFTLHLLSKLNIGHFAIHNGVVVIARKTGGRNGARRIQAKRLGRRRRSRHRKV